MFLSKIKYKHIFQILEWRNKQIKYLRQKRKINLIYQIYYYFFKINNQYNKVKPDQLLYMVNYKKKIIGYGGLVHIDWSNRQSEISFLTSPNIHTNKAIYKKYFNNFFEIIENFAKKKNIILITTETFNHRKINILLLKELGFKIDKKKSQKNSTFQYKSIL